MGSTGRCASWGIPGHTVTLTSLAPLRPRSRSWRCSCGAGGGAWVTLRHAIADASMHLAYPGTPPLVVEPQVEEHW